LLGEYLTLEQLGCLEECVAGCELLYYHLSRVYHTIREK
jgi:(2Fe-2S) ferredoxin